MSPAPFDHFIAIDWTGARGTCHRAIAVAMAPKGDAPPSLIPPPRGRAWSRLGVIDWLRDQIGTSRTLIGFDFSFSLPFLDRGAYLPGSAISVEDMVGLWQSIEQRSSAMGDAYAGGFLDDPSIAAQFLRPGEAAPKDYRRFRRTESACIEQKLGRAETAFHLIGASQVGLASLAGMRALTHLLRDGRFCLWPLHNITDRGPVVVELFCRAFLTMAGAGSRKIRTVDQLNDALVCLGSKPIGSMQSLDDNKTDALVSAAGMRCIAGRSEYWTPKGLSDRVRRTEGWVFGVR